MQRSHPLFAVGLLAIGLAVLPRPVRADEHTGQHRLHTERFHRHYAYGNSERFDQSRPAFGQANGFGRSPYQSGQLFGQNPYQSGQLFGQNPAQSGQLFGQNPYGSMQGNNEQLQRGPYRFKQRYHERFDHRRFRSRERDHEYFEHRGRD